MDDKDDSTWRTTRKAGIATIPIAAAIQIAAALKWTWWLLLAAPLTIPIAGLVAIAATRSLLAAQQRPHLHAESA